MSWPLVQLIDICDTTQGVQITKDNTSAKPYDGGYRYLYIADFLRDNKLSYIDDKFDHKKVTINDLVMANTGSPGKVFKGKDGILSNNLFKISFNQEIVDRDYLYFVLSSEEFQYILQSQMKGGIQKHLGHKTISQQVIPLPPLETQKQIAAVLEKADQLRKDCQQMEQELNSLVQSVFIDMFGDPVTNPKGWDVGIIGEMLSSANYGTSEKSSTEKKKFPVLRMNNITYEGNWDFSALKYMDMSKEDENKYLVKSGDILFNRTNSKELVGKTAVYREATSMAYAGYLVRARCNELAHPDYISSFMNSKYGKKTLQSMCKSIVGMANINAKEFQKIKIAKPPVELQEKFAIRIAAIRTKVADVKQQEAEYNLLFNALMQKAFKGELNL
ncbi:restriction endonuclease subunit S [Vibrio splendidus]|uniref:Restriction endonuclease n=1 Tax=Vibrio splendidus TaxID=29497 RepID=A0A7Y4D7T2_VIBSP|nr:restriction endonuclease subunit S [Vibrio splendidus]NOJ13648.1 restriction endonuclease [Vibrio splendidus]